MKRRLQFVGSIGVPLGAVALAAVAFVLAIGLQQQLADATARVDQLEAAAEQIPELEAAFAHAAALEPRIRALEVAPTSLDAVHPTISAQAFRLVDASGNERAVLQMEEEGPTLRFMPESAPLPAAGLVLGWNQDGPSLRVFDVSGKSQVFIGVTDNGPELTVNGPGLPASQARATLKITPDGLPHLGMLDHEGRPRASLSLSSISGNGDGLLSFWDQDGDGRLLVGVVDDAPEVILADTSDVPRMRLGSYPSGPSFKLHDAGGDARAEFLLNNDGTVGIGLRDDKELRAAMTVAPNGPSLVFFDPEGQTRTSLKSNDAGSSLFLYDAQATFGASLGITSAGTGLSLADGDGNIRATMAVTDKGPAVGLTDAHGTVRSALALTDAGPVLEFADAQGTVRAHLSDTADATRLLLQDEQGSPAAALGVSDDGRVLALFDESGTVRTSAAFTPQGSGFELYDAQGTVRANLGFATDGPALSLNDESQTPRIFAGFYPTTQEAFIATFDAELNTIWISDPQTDPGSEPETTASTGV